MNFRLHRENKFNIFSEESRLTALEKSPNSSSIGQTEEMHDRFWETRGKEGLRKNDRS